MDDHTDSAAAGDSQQSDQTASGISDEEARIFYQRLEEAGQLIDIEYDTDTSQLPPHVTHVRDQAGNVRRIGMS